MVLALELRKTIAKATTYRVRRGNGHAGSILNMRYQDIMAYYTPTNPQTAPQQTNRTKFATAMAEALALTEEERQPYKERAKKEGGITWFNVYIRDYMIA